MKIGYYVQGDADEAVVWGLAKRWCLDAELDANMAQRGQIGMSTGSSWQLLTCEIKSAIILGIIMRLKPAILQ